MTGDVSGDLTGRRLGHYRIDAVLGTGGMSVLYEATDVRLGRKVALKVIGDHLGADSEFRERFVDEARNTSAIDHANIVPLYDFGELDNMLYIAMRLVEGSDLASLISSGPLEPERTVRLLEQVADALDSLHERGLVHLDVKPANVLVTTRHAAREHVYLADFGLTRRGTTGHRTRGGDFLGSPTYAAPEHLRGEPLDGRTDQYALACVFYGCLTGNPPFTGDVPTVIKGHLGGQTPTPSRIVPVPAALDDVVRTGMAKNPADRYSSCAGLLAAARTVLTSGVAPGQAAPAAAASTAQDRAGGGGQRQGQAGPPAARGQPPGTSPQGTPARGQPPQGQPSTPPHGQPPAQGTPPQGQPGSPPPFGPPPGHPNQPPGLGAAPQGGMPPQARPPQQPPTGDPVRLRPPAPASTPAFVRDTGTRRRWLVPTLVGVVLVGAIVALVLIFATGGDEGGQPASPSQENSPAPQIPVGPSESQSNPSTSSTSKPLPTSIPVKPAPGD